MASAEAVEAVLQLAPVLAGKLAEELSAVLLEVLRAISIGVNHQFWALHPGQPITMAVANGHEAECVAEATARLFGCLWHHTPIAIAPRRELIENHVALAPEVFFHLCRRHPVHVAVGRQGAHRPRAFLDPRPLSFAQFGVARLVDGYHSARANPHGNGHDDWQLHFFRLFVIILVVLTFKEYSISSVYSKTIVILVFTRRDNNSDC